VRGTKAVGAGPLFERARRPLLALAVLVVATANAIVLVHILEASASGPSLSGRDQGTFFTSGPLPTLPAATEITEPTTTTTAPAPAPSPALQTTTGPQSIATTVNGTPSDITDPSTVAHSTVGTLPLYRYPGAPVAEATLPNPNYLGAPLVLLVAGSTPGWIETYVPFRPNEATAWVPAQDVSLGAVPCHIAVGIGAHKLVLYCNNAPVFSAPVATGSPDSPTPTGSYFVAYMVRLTDPGGVYGPYAFGLSAFSNTYYSFDGGPGQIAIHGTNQPWVIGSYASHGCIRLNNSDISKLAAVVAPGTPVEIGA
jgi:lipoprotein-anchoring transpeptidase ErfK/SrfK